MQQPETVEGAQAWRSRNPLLIPTLPPVRCVILDKCLSHSGCILSSTSVKEQSKTKRISQVPHKIKMLHVIVLANKLCEIKLPRLKKITICATSAKLTTTYIIQTKSHHTSIGLKNVSYPK